MPQGYAEEGQEKEKKKKWWGDLFKRRVRKVSESSSDEEEDNKKKSFLKIRKKHDRGSKDVTNSFLINPGFQPVRGKSLESVSTNVQSGKKRIKAKVEASRDQLAKDSSSDEGSSYTSSLPSGGSFPRRSRAARTERHNRRLWTASVVYQESNDYDTKYRAKTRSATPSPAASPKVRQKKSLQDTEPVPPPRRMDIPKYSPPVYTAPSKPRAKPRYNGLPYNPNELVTPRDWSELEINNIDRQVTEEKKPPAPPKRLSSSEERKRQANLEEALNELEAIYKKLEDLQEPTEEAEDGEPLMTDDMAYRRLNKREPSCQDVREIVSQSGSYLLVSPTLSPPPISQQITTSSIDEPDITLDDVVYRSVNHTNNTLKIFDPQPPFGIPLGPISPAANSDYLHAEPTYDFNPPNTPDIVRDDLAFRNLRKDSHELRKKKAVRSMSANLSNVILKNNNNYSATNNNINGKSQSYANIPEEMKLAQRVMDIRRTKKVNAKPNPSPRLTNEELRRRFFAESYSPSESDLLKELEDEARATSLELEQQLSKSKRDALYSRSVTDLLKELTKNLDSDFGQNSACTTCGIDDTSKKSFRDISNNNCYRLNEHTHMYKPLSPRSERPKLSKERALTSLDSPSFRKKLPFSQNVPMSHEYRTRLTSPLNDFKIDSVPKGFTPYRPQSSVRQCSENLPKTSRKLENPRSLDFYAKEDPKRVELSLNLMGKPDGIRLKDSTNYRQHPELHSSSLKVKSENVKPWDGYKGRSESYHGQNRPNGNSWDSSNIYRRTPSPRVKETNPRCWGTPEALHNENDPINSKWSGPFVTDYLPSSPKPWTGFNGIEGLQPRDRSYSPMWQPLNGTKSFDEHRSVERLSPRPKWSSLKSRPLQETYIGPIDDKSWHISDAASPINQGLTSTIEPNLGALKDNQISSKWQELSGSSLESPSFSMEYRKETPRNKWNTSDISTPPQKIKHPAPWRHPVPDFGVKANQNLQPELETPKPWDEMTEICKKMQSESYTYQPNRETTDLWEDFKNEGASWRPNSSDSGDENSKNAKNGVDRPFAGEERTPTLLSSSPIDVAAMEAESDEEDKKGQGLSQKPASSVSTSEK